MSLPVCNGYNPVIHSGIASEHTLQNIIGKCDHCYEYKQHRCDIHHQTYTRRRTGSQRIQYSGMLSDLLHLHQAVVNLFRLRTKDFSQNNRTRSSHQRGRKQMFRKQNPRHRITSRQHTDISSHHCSGYRPHSGNHNQKYFRPVHRRQIILDQNRGFRHSQKHIARRNQSFGSGNIHETS